VLKKQRRSPKLESGFASFEMMLLQFISSAMDEIRDVITSCSVYLLLLPFSPVVLNCDVFSPF